jgi:FtsH-binding integral membrane protein
VAALFCGYIAYDWAKAQEESPTADNAVDACVGLYLDIINLFLRILSSSSSSKSRSSRK